MGDLFKRNVNRNSVALNSLICLVELNGLDKLDKKLEDALQWYSPLFY